MMSEYQVARYATDVRLFTWTAGTTEIMKEITARQLGFYDR